MPERPLSFVERLEHHAARVLCSLPPRVQVLLCGGRPVERDGLTLHPQLQLLLALRRRMGGRSLMHGTPGEARRRLRREALVHAGPRCEVGQVRDLDLDTPHRPLRARLYQPPAGGPPPPLLVFFHGGGYVLGDLDTHDPACRLFCCHGRMAVLSVDYALAPEAPFPAGLEDAQAAFAWAVANAAALGLDPARVAVGGDSAGAGLSAALSAQAAAGHGPVPAAQLLLYPALDRTLDRPSVALFAEGFFLTRDDVDRFAGLYLGGADRTDPRVSPLLAPGFEGLPPTLVVTAGFDPLRDEGEAYAEALRAAGVPVRLRRFESFIHGFASMTGVSGACEAAVLELAGELRTMLPEVRT